jgi:hypothetical protein
MYNGHMVSYTKHESKNIYIHLNIAEVLRGRTEKSALSVTEIYEKLLENYNFDGNRKTIARNINGMSDEFKLLSSGERPVKYWMDSYFEPSVNVSLNPTQIQIIAYALRNLENTSIKPLAILIKQTESVLLSNLPVKLKSEVKYALKSYKTLSAKPKPITYPKNNITMILLAIRKKAWITAKVKDQSLSAADRDIVRRLAIINIWFEDGDPTVRLFDSTDNKYKTLSATLFNSIKVTTERVADKTIRACTLR